MELKKIKRGPCLECGECPYYLAYGEPETTDEQNEQILEHCKTCTVFEHTLVTDAIDDFALQLLNIFSAPKYQPTPRDPIKHTMIPYLIHVIEDTRKSLIKKHLARLEDVENE